jgi:hypothetical protein
VWRVAYIVWSISDFLWLLLFYSFFLSIGDCGAIGGIKIGRGNRNTRRKPTPAPLCPPQIPLDQTRVWTRAAAVESQRLTAWAAHALDRGTTVIGALELQLLLCCGVEELGHSRVILTENSFLKKSRRNRIGSLSRVCSYSCIPEEDAFSLSL